MKRVFGVKKDKEPLPSVQDASDRINKRGETVEEKIKRLDTELAKYREQLKKTRPGPTQEVIKSRAMRVLTQKKMYEGQRDMLYNQTFNLDQVAFAAEGIKDAQQTMAAMMSANKELKGMMKTVKIQDFESMQDEMMDLMDVSNEIQESLGRSYNVPGDLDEEELMGAYTDIPHSRTRNSNPPCQSQIKMQTKINAFFKPRSLPQIPQDYEAGQLIQDQQISGISTNSKESAGCTIQVSAGSESISTSSKSINNKRKYAQLHLDLGQSDFLLRFCSTCGFKYACGDKVDEKLHTDFHKDFTHGIEFKGWQNERVVRTLPGNAGRILLVLDEDPPAHMKKVEKVLHMMEVEIGSGSLIRKNCQIYLYIFQRRVVGCLIVQPISEAHRVVTKSQTLQCPDNSVTKTRQDSSVLNFGGFQMQREVRAKSVSSNKDAALAEDLMGAIFIDKEPIPAVCGIRAIWVVTAMRRKHIASQLLDIARMNFLKGTVLDHSQLAFSDPTSAGRALASRYCGSSFLAYRADI